MLGERDPIREVGDACRSCKLQISASEIYQTKFTGSVSLVFFKTVSSSVQVKLEHFPDINCLALIRNNRRAPQQWSFPRALVRFLTCNQARARYSHSGGAWTLARNDRTFPDFRCVHSLRAMAVLLRALLSGEAAKARARSARTSGEANLLAVSMSQPWLVCALDQSLHAA